MILDRAGPATAYPDRTGAWASTANSLTSKGLSDQPLGRLAAVRDGASGVRCEGPSLVQEAWYCLDVHRRYGRCEECPENGDCSAVEVARARIRQWRRLRYLRGRR
ncbi:hypothetical protein GCM10012279_41250 [Micromonospora yangpuensis]|uniref:Uncharacterized protein n=1 Tax=Micromonospora yangpuensis TaxID=683228 RepID=A0A1C6V5W1_9ACTN|nr:hypothetical protein GCM10012279_41250 [Micromonospora yangpuensis]SCL61668.1 hypothetical protein GA0070617_4733 [Micromonospora yangpuensis]